MTGGLWRFVAAACPHREICNGFDHWPGQLCADDVVDNADLETDRSSGGAPTSVERDRARRCARVRYDEPAGHAREFAQAQPASAFTASSTFAAWPGTLTFRQISLILPLASISSVVRSIPMYLRPYIDFSTQTP